MASAAEKRKSARYDCQVPVVSQKAARFSDTQTTDISKGGVGFISKNRIPIDTKMLVELNLTPEGEPVVAVGEVRWVTKILESDLYRVGMTFTEILDGSRASLSKHFA
ncbi:MAG: PilZ domain-containing protein [Candidatus Omnitrophota bacterium]